jgi:FkbM family methyltransferase
MTLSLILSTYEQPASLAKVLRGIQLQTQTPDEIFITDDGSGEETRDVIERFRRECPVPVQHLCHPHDGFRKVILLNKAVAAARGDYLVFTDGDCVPHRRFIDDRCRLAERGYWVQGRRCHIKEEFVPTFEPGQTPVWRWLLCGRIGGGNKGFRLPLALVLRNQKQRGILGCNMAYWREDVLAVNGFDETYLGRGIAPDSDLGTRIYNLGRRRKFVYFQALVFHLDHPVMPRENLARKRQWLDHPHGEDLVRTRLAAATLKPLGSQPAPESELVWQCFACRKDGFFVDVGANEPQQGSQTWFLEEQGWQGILVEPLAELCQRLRQARPRSRVFQVACGAPGHPPALPFHVAQAASKSGLVKNLVETSTRYVHTELAPVMTLDELLNQAGNPRLDFVSIDVEGTQLDVLRGFTLQQHHPGLLLMEDHLHNLAVHRYLRQQGYRLVKRTGLNNWYVPRTARFTLSTALERARLWKKVWLNTPIRRLRVRRERRRAARATAVR